MSAAKLRPKARSGPGRLSADEAAGLEDRLLDAAFRQFAERGFGDATIDEIARRAGASTKTLYSRFANKSEILEAVVQRNVRRAIEDHIRAFGLNPKTTGPREFLMKLGVQVAGATDEETSGITRVTFAESHRFPLLRRLYRDVTGRGVTAIMRGLHDWRDAGLVDFKDDAELLASLCFGTMTDGPRIRSVLGDPMSHAEVERHVTAAVDLFLRAIEPQAAKKKGQRRR